MLGTRNGGTVASLLLVEYGKDDEGEQLQSLVQYRFEAGRLAGAREPLVTTRTIDVRFDLGTNYLHQNRCVITNWGDVIDLETRQVVRRGRGQVVRVAGDRVIERVPPKWEEEGGMFSFDLKSRRSARVNLYNPEGRHAGVISPDGRRSVEDGGSDSLFLYEEGAERRSLGSSFGGSLGYIEGPLPALWLDNKTLLAIERGGRVVRLDVVTGKVTPIVQAPICGERDEGTARLGQDPGGTVYFEWYDYDQLELREWNQRIVAIDVEGRRVVPYDWVTLRDGFDFRRERDPNYGHLLRHRGAKIGRLWCNAWQAETADSCFAVKYGAAGSNLGYPEGVAVWSAESGAWTSIRPESLTTVIGWVVEGASRYPT
ncbi:MAG TPA: hypothetical protein VE093_24615 [Polyangiaceae bacterium]|nr:hypothetical protein [Polyangiaceae bacterium]